MVLWVKNSSKSLGNVNASVVNKYTYQNFVCSFNLSDNPSKVEENVLN